MRFHNNSRDRSFARLKYIVEKLGVGEQVTPKDYLYAVLTESKHDQNYDNAEEAFVFFLKHLNYVAPFRPKKNYIDDEITVFQRAISTLIRYAPVPQKALDYTAYLLGKSPPLHDEHCETICLINHISVYKTDGSPDSMNKALELIQMGLDRKVHLLVPCMNHERDDVTVVFKRVS